ncbi:hypothetical protein AKJ55_01085 [candidate division MSBL1 archaeon SCGC-AAA382M17]|uniref:Molybdate/tungstate import ATP-binding protein WtpC n=1 Tax=candidate division MSBL1 archaeon SCGC-AAA382M17 TaxID=1698284 RepID=A0ABR5TJP6_9EURY|nr:hypothetical protein AKJ55_01085 [candidate division MSBL1 archaeon SCGC-AAA382M17]
MISIRGLSRKWQDFKLEDISLDVKDQEYFVILGPTGAGKTLVLELIAGFHEPDEGEIRMGQKDVTNLSPQERDVGFVYQNYSLFPHLTVEENIEFGPAVQKVSDKRVGERKIGIMDTLDISHLKDRYPKTLSGGEQQKVALARALILDPKILLLDEPISALDVPSQEEVRQRLKDIHRESEITTIHVTHNREEASWLGDRLGVMSDGKIVQIGSPDEVFRKPKSEFVANFVGTENVFPGTSNMEEEISKIDIGGGVEIQSTEIREGEVKACIRPEEIIVSNQPIKSSGRNMFEGEIVGVSDLENTVRLEIDTGRNFTVVVTKKSRSDMNLKIGKKVYIAFKASSVHVI